MGRGPRRLPPGAREHHHRALERARGRVEAAERELAAAQRARDKAAAAALGLGMSYAETADHVGVPPATLHQRGLAR